MAEPVIFKLPTEIHQNIFGYLDWDQCVHLTPTRPNIINISETCKHFRKAVIPLLFRNVTLKLRWVNGAVAEPALLRLRQRCPDLAQYVRCVHVETLFGHFMNSEWQPSGLKPFTIPSELQEWVSSSGRADTAGYNGESPPPPDQVQSVVEKLLETPQCKDFLKDAPQESIDRFMDIARSISKHVLTTPALSDPNSYNKRVRVGDRTFLDDGREEALANLSTPRFAEYNRIRDQRFQLDAFFVLILCFPPQMTNLLFESLATDRMDALQDQFSMHIASLAMKVYAPRLQNLTLQTDLTRTLAILSERDPSNNPPPQPFAEAFENLPAVKSLTLSGSKGYRFDSAGLISTFYTPSIAATLTCLHLRNIEGEATPIIDFVEKFPSLHSLSLNDIDLRTPHNIGLPQRRWHPQKSIYLDFLIALRRRLPVLALKVPGWQLSARENLPAAGVRWLLREAVPEGKGVDFERETRLVEDFESFRALWEAEDDAERGDKAREEHRSGRLVDLALSSRWRGLR